MKTIELKVYKFNELEEDIQDQVIDKWRINSYGYDFLDKYVESLEEFCRIFGMKIKDYSLGSQYCNVNIHGYTNMEYNIQNYDEMTDIRKWKYFMNNFYYPYFQYRKTYYLNGNYKKKRVSRIIELDPLENCPLTGFCGDYDLLKPIGEYIKNPHAYDSMSDLFYNCVEEWLSSVKREIEWQDSREYIQDIIENNDYDFLSNGEIYQG